MLTDTQVVHDHIDALTPRRGLWIDALLLMAGALLTVRGTPEFGVPLAVLGCVLPLLRWSGKNHGLGDLYALVPVELAQSHRAVVDAASLQGVFDTTDIVDAADDLLLEVAAVLAGRPVRGAAQHRFISARTDVLGAVAVELRERNVAWLAAHEELAAMQPIIVTQEPTRERAGALVALFVVVLFPAFLGWDAMRLVGHLIIRLVEGVLLRGRALVRLLYRVGDAVAVAVARARTTWRNVRDVLRSSVVEARHRIVYRKMRLRQRLRRARRQASLFR